MDKARDHKTMLFAAGGLTGLIGVTVLVLGLGAQDLAFGASPTPPAVTVETVPVTSMSALAPEGIVAPTVVPVVATPAGTSDATGQLEQVADQNAQLRQSLQLMLEREAAYRQQLEAASQTILTMQAPPVTAAAVGEGVAQAWSEGADDDQDSHEDDEHDEHEHENEEREHDGGEHEDD